MVIGSCRDLVADVNTLSKASSAVKKVVRLRSDVVLPAKKTINVPIKLGKKKVKANHCGLPEGRDFLFEPQLNASDRLGIGGGVYAHVVDAGMSFVQVHNDTNHPVTWISCRTAVILQFPKQLPTQLETGELPPG